MKTFDASPGVQAIRARFACPPPQARQPGVNMKVRQWYNANATGFKATPSPFYGCVDPDP